MKKIFRKKFKNGIASFYIVAFSTLILVVLAMSFAAVIISESGRTSNDDLAQSAYDSALAGIEDAKLAYYNYQSCLESKASFTGLTDPKEDGTTTVDCDDIVYWMKHPNCSMVGHILGRIPKGEEGEVFISEKTGNNRTPMQQAYTCVQILTSTNDYRTTLTNSNPTRVIQVKLGDGKSVDDIQYVKVNWYSNSDGADYQFTNFNANKVVFPDLGKKVATPPTLSLGMVQTDATFTLEEFDKVAGSSTNRGTVFLVPTNKQESAAGKNIPDNYLGAYKPEKGGNYLSAGDIVKSNDRTVKNLPYAVYCNDSTGEFACSTTIELPRPIKHSANEATRNEETFVFVASIPYGQPSTDVSLEFCDTEDCTRMETVDGVEESVPYTIELENMQVIIDSTGRANDLFRRIEARTESTDITFPFPLYALELLGEGGTNLEKNMTVICEYQSWSGGEFSPTCP